MEAPGLVLEQDPEDRELEGLGHEHVALPNGRLIDCSDPWWEGQTPADPADTPDTPDDPDTPDEEEGDGRISVRVVLEDRDDQLTPADEARLRKKKQAKERKASRRGSNWS